MFLCDYNSLRLNDIIYLSNEHNFYFIFHGKNNKMRMRWYFLCLFTNIYSDVCESVRLCMKVYNLYVMLCLLMTHGYVIWASAKTKYIQERRPTFWLFIIKYEFECKMHFVENKKYLDLYMDLFFSHIQCDYIFTHSSFIYTS